MNRKNQSRIIPILTIIFGVLLIGTATYFGLLRNNFSPVATATLPQSSKEVPRISLEDARSAFDSGEAFFLDVRDRESYDYAHIPGALNIPASELESRLDEVPLDKLILLY